MKCPGEAYKDKALNFRIKSILKSQERHHQIASVNGAEANNTDLYLQCFACLAASGKTLISFSVILLGILQHR